MSIPAASADTRQLLRLAAARGWVFRRTNGGHVLGVWPPTGATVTLPSTPSDSRSLLNSRADLERHSGRLRPAPGPGHSTGDRAHTRRRQQARDDAARRRRRAVRPAPPLPTPPTPMPAALTAWLDHNPIVTKEQITDDRSSAAS